MSQPETVVFEPFDPGHLHDSIPCIPRDVDTTDPLALFILTFLQIYTM
jgi:hypothetical protein